MKSKGKGSSIMGVKKSERKKSVMRKKKPLPKRNSAARANDYFKFLKTRRQQSHYVQPTYIEKEKKTADKLSTLHFEGLLGNFRPKDRYRISRILQIIQKNSDIISWNPADFSLTIHGQHYPRSNLMDIFSYLLGDYEDTFYSEDLLVMDRKNISIPMETGRFLSVISNILGGTKSVNKTLLFNIQRMTDAMNIFKELQTWREEEKEELDKVAMEKRKEEEWQTVRNRAMSEKRVRKKHFPDESSKITPRTYPRTQKKPHTNGKTDRLEALKKKVERRKKLRRKEIGSMVKKLKFDDPDDSKWTDGGKDDVKKKLDVTQTDDDDDEYESAEDSEEDNAAEDTFDDTMKTFVASATPFQPKRSKRERKEYKKYTPS